MTLLHYIIPKILGAKENYYNNYNGTGFTDYLQLVENINNNELRTEDIPLTIFVSRIHFINTST